MADNLDSLTFGIEETMEGIGDSTLLNDLLAPETSTADVDKIEPIVKEVKDDKPEDKKTPKIKEVKDEAPAEQNILKDFLGEGDEEEGEEAPVEPLEAPQEVVSEEGTQFTALAKDLLKLGVFTIEEGEEDVPIATAEDFLERFNAEKKKGAIEVVNNFIGQFGEDYQQAFDAIYVKGVNPKDYFSAYNQIVDLAGVDLTIEENQVAILRRAFSEQGLEPEDINTEIDQAKNYGDLEAKAIKYHKVLVKKDALKLQQMEQKAEYEKQQKANLRNQYIQNVQTILQDKLKGKEFDGIPLNPKLAAELQDFLLVDKYKTATGETLTDFDKFVLELEKRPENHAMKVKVALLLKILEKDPTLSTIQRSGVTKKSNELFGEVARQVAKKPVQQTNTQNSWFK